MKQSLQLKIGQSLTMTPQLQQAIRLLQLSTLDLAQEIQQTIESNPMLDYAPEEESNGESAKENSSESNPETAANGEEQTAQRDDSELQMEKSELPDDLDIDSGWEDVYETPQVPSLSNNSQSSFEGKELEFQNSAEETLQEHLFWQLEMTPLAGSDHAIATAIIDAIDPHGYLTSTLEDLHSGLITEFAELELDEIEAVLKRVHQFDPIGCGSRNLQECLSLQLSQFAADTPWLNEAKLLVSHYLEILGAKDYNQLMRKMKLKQPELREVVTLVQSLNPRPGSLIAPEKPQYIIPDVFVRKRKNKWMVELNPECSPKLQIHSQYASLIRRSDNSSENLFLRNNLQEAKWFIKSLQSRNETLLKVASQIVAHQQEFFEHGEEYMKPLVLHDIAERVEMHESTISRVTTQKYMHTPRGIFELKYFFSSHVSTDSGGECSATAIRALIKKLIAEENQSKPLSDSKIANILADKGINVARRTIAKYREAMSIPPSNARKSLV